MKTISKVIMPVAGLGTRSLPVSKNIPKEMLSILNKPVIQYVVEEALEAALCDVIFVTGREKTAIEDHFDYNLPLEKILENAGKTELLQTVKNVAEMINVITVRQKKQLGLGHAVLCAEKIIHDEFFGVMVGDDIILGEPSGMKQLIDIAQKENAPVIGVLEVEPENVNKYGIVAGNKRADGIIEITDMVEKPAIGSAPSNMAIIGRYVLPPEIFKYLHKTTAGHGGEIQLTDALRDYARDHKMLAVPIKGIRFDAGDWVDYLTANVFFGLKDARIKPVLIKRIQKLLQEFSE